jgi:DNA-binding beta-propeller fold protein YncE
MKTALQPSTSRFTRESLMKMLGATTAFVLLFVCVAAISADTDTAPKFKFDPTWPKPLPNKWKMGGVTGLAVDKDDNVWVFDRPNDLTDIELEAELNPPIADCCVRPPSMIHIDKEGNVIGSFDAPQGHGMAVDSKGFAYLGNAENGLNTVHKYDEKTGKLVGEVPRAPEAQPGGGGDAAVPNPRPPGRGSMGPVAGFLPGGRTRPDPAAVAARKAATEAFIAKYPPTTPMIVGQVEEVRLDEPAHEVYVADSYLGGRVMVFDLDTLKFKRGWGAYGHTLEQITTNDADRAYTPGGPMPKEFRGHLTLNISHDGMLYAADRMANRIQVFTKDGKFLKEFIVKPETGVGGATGGVMFSPDKAQRFLYISDLTNNHVYFLNRETGAVVGQMGTMGENGGQFFGLHMEAVDSKGNLYTGEVFAGERVQRFLPVK